MEITISEMTLDDVVSVENTLLKDFDDFWSVQTLKEDLSTSLSKYLVAKKLNDVVRICGNKNYFRYCRNYEHCNEKKYAKYWYRLTFTNRGNKIL